MPGTDTFTLHFWDYFAFIAFFVGLSAVGYWAGRKERSGATEYFLAALFGAIQSTVNSVLNSTATIFTLDIYQRWIHRTADDRQLVRVGVLSSIVVLLIAIVLGGFIIPTGATQ